MTATTPNPYGIQVVTSPGGLSDTAHIVNVIVVLMTCGLWIPVYILLALTAPKVNAQVTPSTPPTTPRWPPRRSSAPTAGGTWPCSASSPVRSPSSAASDSS